MLLLSGIMNGGVLYLGSVRMSWPDYKHDNLIIR